jgi:tRNA pseudouridine32 synthase/23S rRNA pseudouridine746 synthase
MIRTPGAGGNLGNERRLSFPTPAAIEMNLTLKITAEAKASTTACVLLAAASGLSKGRIKEAMGKGAVWLRHGKKRRRLRRATTIPSSGDVLELYYNEKLLARKPPLSDCLVDEGPYSLWYKPAGLLAQGNNYGDHCSLLRQAELRTRRPVFLVHRLDREAAGLMLIAHSREAAARLSRLFRENSIDKTYVVRVSGRLQAPQGAIDQPLDGKTARTEYVVSHYDSDADTTLVSVTLKSGRLHQIRRHFALLGHPVMGDPRYGSDNKDAAGLQLQAVGLAFRCPISGAHRAYRLPSNSFPTIVDQI